MTFRPLAVLSALLLFISSSAPLFAQSSSASSYYERGRTAMLEENWYEAAESFLESLRINPSYAESVAALAECYYSLGEFDQALSWVRKARTLSRGSTALANLEAFILIAQGNLEGADSVVTEVLSREPYNKEALFAAAELDVARGKAGSAAIRYREAARRYPDDRRALLSLALVLGSLGDLEGARSFASRAAAQNPDDPRVLFYAAYLEASAGRFEAAGKELEAALTLKSDYALARSLLAQVRYRLGRYEEAVRLADENIAANRNDASSWYLKGLSFARLGRPADARSVLASALSIDPQDEFVRAALEDLVVSSTSAESAERSRWARFHFDNARDYRGRNLSDQALFEYRRGLRLDPYSKERAAYADLLRTLGYPARQLAELRFMQELGKADRAVNDAVEAYDSLLTDALYRRWSVDPAALESRHWKVAVVSVAGQSASRHVDAGPIAAAFTRDVLVHDDNIDSVNIEVRQPSFSAAFRSAREAGADYFLIVSATESGRDLSLKGELYVARTGSAAANFSAFRTGESRLRNAVKKIADGLGAALPFRGVLVSRRAGVALIDKGRVNGVAAKAAYEIVRAGSMIPLNEGIGLSYSREDVVGTITVDEVDEQVSMGTLARTGFFDRIAAGDEVVAVPPADPAKKAKAGGQEAVVADPELRWLLRNLR
jgi:tetratricopeptide (TPR) repeat protein